MAGAPSPTREARVLPGQRVGSEEAGRDVAVPSAAHSATRAEGEVPGEAAAVTIADCRLKIAESRSGERTRLACWFRRHRRNNAFKVRDGGGAIANTRGACAPRTKGGIQRMRERGAVAGARRVSVGKREALQIVGGRELRIEDWRIEPAGSAFAGVGANDRFRTSAAIQYRTVDRTLFVTLKSFIGSIESGGGCREVF
jgi:hypothetical protein